MFLSAVAGEKITPNFFTPKQPKLASGGGVRVVHFYSSSIRPSGLSVRSHPKVQGPLERFSKWQGKAPKEQELTSPIQLKSSVRTKPSAATAESKEELNLKAMRSFSENAYSD